MRRIILLILGVSALSACHVDHSHVTFSEALKMNHNEFRHCRISNMNGLYWTRAANTESEACRLASLACRQYQDRVHYTHHFSQCRRVMLR